MPTLSLAMIVKNEAGTLAQCLDSVRGVVDELVVVDTGSTDGTPEVAQSFGAQVHDFAWINDFAAARNESLRHCTGDWVLILDADEAIDVLDHAPLREALHQEPWMAYRLISRNYTHQRNQMLFDQVALANESPYSQGRDYPFYSDQPNLRLCRRLPGLAFEGRIHEMLDPFFQRQGLAVGSLAVVAHHFGKLNPDREAPKKATYLALAKQDAADHPNDPQRQFNLLQQAYHAGAWEIAVAAGLQCLDRLGQTSPAIAVPLGIALQQLGRHEAALAHLQQALRIQPGHLAASSALPLSYMALGKLDAARQMLGPLVAQHPGFLPAHLALAELEEREGHLAAARMALLEALPFHPRDEGLRTSLLQLSLRHGHLPQAALDAVEALKAIPTGGQGHWHALAVEVLRALGQTPQTRPLLQAGLRAFPDHPALNQLATKDPGFTRS